jgi:uncharacterized protein (DUF58 family)
MIYPTVRAILLAALGAPLGLALAMAGGSLWLLGAAWVAAVTAALFADGWLGADRRKAEIGLVGPQAYVLGRAAQATVEVGFARAAPRRVEFALQTNARLTVQPERLGARVRGGKAQARFDILPSRRGEAQIQTLWVRWTGPMGLAFKQRREALDLQAPITLDIQRVKDEVSRLAAVSLLQGAHVQYAQSGASEFHALVEYRPGMSLRMIDWKQSARHRALLAKDYEAERNHHIILACDSGRQMCEPVRGLPRIDQVLQASLLLAFGALKAGDLVGLYAFDERPRLWTGALSGQGAFAALQRLASRIDYGSSETNYTLGLVQLGAHLQRRSLVVIFTEFTDSTTAELMIEHIGRLLRTHLVLFVVIEDEELMGLERAPIAGAADVAKAVIAGALAAERELVIARLRRMGVDILQADLDRLGPALLARYAQIKQRNLL